MLLVIHTDGGSRGNPGPAASAFTVHNKQNELLHSDKLFLGDATNNIAEYTALRMAWDWVIQNKNKEISEVDFFLDSELVVKQMKGEYKIKDKNLLAIATNIKSLEKKSNISFKYMHVPRADNSEADALVNAALDAEIK